jgi:hypothetical protein
MDTTVLGHWKFRIIWMVDKEWEPLTYLPRKMEQTECSETSAHKIQTPGNYPEENIQQGMRSTLYHSPQVPGCWCIHMKQWSTMRLWAVGFVKWVVDFTCAFGALGWIGREQWPVYITVHFVKENLTVSEELWSVLC